MSQESSHIALSSHGDIQDDQGVDGERAPALVQSSEAPTMAMERGRNSGSSAAAFMLAVAG